jgi:hypothetical protein
MVGQTKNLASFGFRMILIPQPEPKLLDSIAF